MFTIGQELQVTVEKLVFGAKGLIRHAGWVIFVADVLPGEEVIVRLVAKKKSYYEADLVRVVTPSPNRIDAPCPYFTRCGGCQLQHAPYSKQLEYKKEWLLDALRRELKIECTFPVGITASPKQYGYRRKVILHGPSCGFYARDNSTIIPIERCLLFSEQTFRHIKAAAHAEKTIVMRDSRDKIAVSDEIMQETVDGLVVYYSANVFVQNNPELALILYNDVLASMHEGPILDLYSGVGVFALLAAKKGHKVHAVELDKNAVALADLSKQANALNNVTFVAKPCEKLTKAETKGVDQWLVNPPRVGLSKEVLGHIMRCAPKNVVYISCMPATLARDIKVFYEHGYKIERAQVYDMFSQTTHLETVVYLTNRN